MNALPPPGNTEWHQQAVRTSMTRELSATFAGGPYAAAAARRALGGLGELVSHRRLADIALLVSELVTNSVRHGGAGEDDRLELAALREGQRLRVEVTDWGPGGGAGAGAWGCRPGAGLSPAPPARAAPPTRSAAGVSCSSSGSPTA